MKKENKMSAYKIESIQTASFNGRAVKIFKAWKLVDEAYLFCGSYTAPARTANKNLINFIVS